jgi:GntR family transcriptional repressor for pyruvate dehydrogenase complex
LEQKELHQKSYTRVIEYIKEQIRSGSLEVGSRLPAERDLSAILGISRNSVREAIRTLDIMGVITCQQGAGNYVTCNFKYNLMETMSMMFLLDQIDYGQISQLHRSLELQALFDVIDQFISDLRRKMISSPDSKSILLEAHNNILRSLVTRDKELACKAVNSYFDMLD